MPAKGSMALIWQRQKSRSTDFLGNNDECYAFQGDHHKHLAERFLAEISRQHKQVLFIYGEGGIGKTRLAKNTARELADRVNIEKPILYLFRINCEKYQDEDDLTEAHLGSKVAQAVAAVDEELSGKLSRCGISDFASCLSSSLSKRMFLFLFDGINTSANAIVTFINRLVECNNNVLILTTSSEHFTVTRQRTKVSTHVCDGLSLKASRDLLQEVSGQQSQHSTEELENDIVSLCHYNPFFIMRAGEQMREDSLFPYSLEEMKQVLEGSLMLAMSGNNVPDRDDFSKRAHGLTKKLTQNMGRNIGLVLQQEERQFTIHDVAPGMDKPISDGKLKKSLLEPLAESSVLTQANGFYSLKKTFQDFCTEQAPLLDTHKDEVVVEVFKILRQTLNPFLSPTGIQKIFMVHGDDMKVIQDRMRMISKVGPNSIETRFVSRAHFIDACCAFLSNIPLDHAVVSVFKEQSFVHLHQVQKQERSAGSLSTLAQEMIELGISDEMLKGTTSSEGGIARDRRDRREVYGVQEQDPAGSMEDWRGNAGGGQRQYYPREKGPEKPGEEKGGKDHWHANKVVGYERQPGGYQQDRRGRNGLGLPGGACGDTAGDTVFVPLKDSQRRLGQGYSEGSSRRNRNHEIGQYKERETQTPACEQRPRARDNHGSRPDDRRTEDGSNTQGPSDNSMQDRFGFFKEQASPSSHSTDFSSLRSSDECAPNTGSITGQDNAIGNKTTKLDFCAMYPEPPPASRYCPPPSKNIPVESTDPSAGSPPRWVTTGPGEDSFHEWDEVLAPRGEWSMENNPPSPSQSGPHL